MNWPEQRKRLIQVHPARPRDPTSILIISTGLKLSAPTKLLHRVAGDSRQLLPDENMESVNPSVDAELRCRAAQKRQHPAFFVSTLRHQATLLPWLVEIFRLDSRHCLTDLARVGKAWYGVRIGQHNYFQEGQGGPPKLACSDMIYAIAHERNLRLKRGTLQPDSTGSLE